MGAASRHQFEARPERHEPGTGRARLARLAKGSGVDRIEDRLRANLRATIEAVFEEDLARFLGRLRHRHGDGPAKGYRHAHRERQRSGTFGTGTVRVQRARIVGEAGKETEWRSKALPLTSARRT